MSDVVICPPRPADVLPLNAVMATGFGFVVVTRDGETVWQGDDEHVWLRRFENRAKADPDHDWRVEFMGPLSDATYQRQDTGWVCIKRGLGFA